MSFKSRRGSVSQERELCAVNQSPDDFVERPTWVKLWTHAWWSTGPGPSQRQAYIVEAICMGCGIAVLVASFFVPPAHDDFSRWGGLYAGVRDATRGTAQTSDVLFGC